jgi:hypothetical protein
MKADAEDFGAIIGIFMVFIGTLIAIFFST